MRLIEPPRFISKDVYQSRIAETVKRVSLLPEFVSAYQIGSIGDPGISDVDIVVVLKADASTQSNPRSNLDEDSKYIFCHPLFGISEDRFVRSRQLSLFKNYVCLLYTSPSPRD